MANAAIIGDSEMRLAQAKLSHSAGKLENTAELRQLRRNVARLLTAARAEEIALGARKGSLSHGKIAGLAVGGSGDSGGKSVFLKGVVDKLAGV